MDAAVLWVGAAVACVLIVLWGTIVTDPPRAGPHEHGRKYHTLVRPSHPHRARQGVPAGVGQHPCWHAGSGRSTPKGPAHASGRSDDEVPQHPQASLSRRAALQAAVAINTYATITAAAAAVADSPTYTMADVKRYGKQASALRQAVRSGQGKSKQRVITQTETVLKPLQESMNSVAAGLNLEQELLDKAKIQPLLLKGHYAELAEAVKADQFSEYVSKRTKETFPGGKVERELEEVEDTVKDFLELAAMAKK